MLWKARVKDSVVGRLLSRYSLWQCWTYRGFLLQLCVSVKCIAYIQVLCTYSLDSQEKIYIFIIFSHYHTLMFLHTCPFMTLGGRWGPLDEGYTLPHSGGTSAGWPPLLHMVSSVMGSLFWFSVYFVIPSLLWFSTSASSKAELSK